MKTLQIQKDILTILDKGREKVFFESYDGKMMVALNPYVVYLIPEKNFYINTEKLQEFDFEQFVRDIKLKEIKKTNTTKSIIVENKIIELEIYDCDGMTITTNKKWNKYFEKNDDLTYFINDKKNDINRSPIYVKNYNSLVAIIMPYIERS